MAVAAKYLFTCVHGTWARRSARWIDEGSDLAIGLRQALRSDATVVVTPFRWRGSNTNRAREAGADELAKHIEECAARFPGHRHVVIGHSHGGNVALQGAFRAAQKAEVVCLSTPFVHARSRPSGKRLFVGWLIGLAWWSLLWPEFLRAMASIRITGLVAMALDEGAGELSLRTFTILFLGFVIGYTVAVCSWRMVERQAGKWATVEVAVVPGLIIRIAGDEASGAMTTARMAAWLSRLVEELLQVGGGW